MLAAAMLINFSGCSVSETSSASSETQESQQSSVSSTADSSSDISEPIEEDTSIPAVTTSFTSKTETTTQQSTSAQPEESELSQPENVEPSVPDENTEATTPSDSEESSAPQTEKVTTTVQTTTKPVTTTTEAPVESEPEELDMMGQYEQKLDTLQKLIEKTSKSQTMPVVHITTYNNERVLSKEYYVDSVIDVFNCGEEYRLTAQGGVKVRGNSTADGNEKPYRIKFEKKQNMLGLHDGMKFKSWVLLRSQWNLIPDYTGFSLAEEIFDGEYYSSDSTYVNVYMNGKYLGLYLLCEQNQSGEGRVEVYEPEKDELQPEIGYFLEMDNYANEDEDPFFTLDYDGIEFTDYVGTTRCFEPDDYSIKSDINSDEQKAFISKYLAGVFEIMYEAVENEKILMFDNDYNVVSGEGTYSTPKDAVSAVFDLDSVVNTMILQELVHNYDVGAGSFFMAVDFSEGSRYERLTFLAPWDFNWAYSEETSGRYYAGAFQTPVHDMVERSNVWLTVIMKADWFRDMLKEKWAEMGNGKDLVDKLKEVLQTAQSLENDLGNESWKINSAKDIIAFVKGRIRWLDTQWS